MYYSSNSNYQKTIKHLTDTLNLSRNSLFDFVEQVQSSQEIIMGSVSQIDFSHILEIESFLASIAVELRHPLEETAKVISIAQRQYRRNYGYISNSSQNIAKQIVAQQAAFNQIHLNLVQDMTFIAPHLEKTAESIATILNGIRLTELAAFSNLSASPAFSQLSRNLFQSFQIPDQINYVEGLVGDISFLLQAVAEGEMEQLDDSVASEFERRFAKHIHDLKRGRISYEGVTQLINGLVVMLTLILSWLSLQSSYDSGQTLQETQQITASISSQLDEQRQLLQGLEQHIESVDEQLEELNEETSQSKKYLGTLVELVERLIPYAEQVNDLDENAIILVTKHPTPLRSEPSRHGSIITRIFPNQLVEQVKQEGGWVYVEYFDYIEGIPRMGWIYRRNLILLRE
ncbi:MAG: hypothetical protein IPM53_18140 [Anaerolineaceae bacterium]|nr:hypothetical protein [Anaerolineaceae bacterium]